MGNGCPRPSENSFKNGKQLRLWDDLEAGSNPLIPLVIPVKTPIGEKEKIPCGLWLFVE